MQHFSIYCANNVEKSAAIRAFCVIKIAKHLQQNNVFVKKIKILSCRCEAILYAFSMTVIRNYAI